MAELPLLNWSTADSSFNATSASIGPPTSNSFTDHIRHPWFAFLFIIVGQVIVGNLVLIRAALQRRCYGPPSYTNYFIVSMAIADLIVGTLVMPFGIISLMCRTWMFNAIWCDFWQTFDFFACTVSIFNLCAISIDRHLAISDPFRHQRWVKPSRLLSYSLFLWLLGALITFPPLIVRQIWFSEHVSFRCSNIFTQRIYVLFSSTITFFLPLVTMLLMNCRVHRIAQAKQNQFVPKSISMNVLSSLVSPSNEIAQLTSGLQSTNMSSAAQSTQSITLNLQSKLPSPQSDPTLLSSLYASQSSLNTCSHKTNATVHFCIAPFFDQSRHLELKTHRQTTWLSGQTKATRTLMIVMGAFVICWLPYYTLVSLLAIWPQLPLTKSKWIPITLWLGWCHSAINPIIYTCLSRSFRAVLLRNLTCWFGV